MKNKNNDAGFGEDILPLYKPKPPFMRFEKGHGYQGVLLMKTATEEIQCHLCGEWMYALPVHLRNKHKDTKLNADGYKKLVGLNSGTALVSPKVQRVRKQAWVDRSEESKKQAIKNLLIGQKKRRKTKVKKKPHSMQRKNTHGSCDLQIKTRFEKIYEEAGRIPSSRELVDMDAGLRALIYLRHGSYNAALKKFGFSHTEIKKKDERVKKSVSRVLSEKGRKQTHWTPARIKRSLKEFRKDNGRFPTRNEMGRGVLPSASTVMRNLKIKSIYELDKIV